MSYVITMNSILATGQVHTASHGPFNTTPRLVLEEAACLTAAKSNANPDVRAHIVIISDEKGSFVVQKFDANGDLIKDLI